MQKHLQFGTSVLSVVGADRNFYYAISYTQEIPLMWAKSLTKFRDFTARKTPNRRVVLHNRELKQRRFWAMHVNRKWGNRKWSLLPSHKPRRQQICIAKFLFSYKEDLSGSFNRPTPWWCKKSTSGWRPSLRKRICLSRLIVLSALLLYLRSHRHQKPTDHALDRCRPSVDTCEALEEVRLTIIQSFD